MNKYIKPETKVVKVKMESLLAGSTLGINASDPAGSGDSWNAAGKNHRTNPLWDQSWEDPEEEEGNQ